VLVHAAAFSDHSLSALLYGKSSVQYREQGHVLRPAGLRTLQQSKPNVTAVSTPQQLLDAVSRGDAHIEIRQHLDLTTVTPLHVDGLFMTFSGHPDSFPGSVLSIRVRHFHMPLMHCVGSERQAGCMRTMLVATRSP
jgi:hypothetical protein